MNARPILTAALLLATASALHAGTVLTFQEKDPGGGTDAKALRQIVLDGPRLRMETTGADAGGRVLIFRSDTGTLWVLDEAKRSYTEIHRAEVPFGLDEAKQGTAPEGEAAPAAQNPSPTMVSPDGVAYKKVDSGFIVNGFRTDRYEGTKNGRKVEDLYVADPKTLGLEPADLTTMHSMAETFAEVKGKSPIRLSLVAEVPGVPVRTVRFEGGKPALQIDLTSVRKEEVPAGRFELPEGFTRLAQGLSSQ